MGLGERPPAAADGIEDRAGEVGRGAFGESRVDGALGGLRPFGQQRLDRQGAERHRDPALAHMVAEGLGEFEAASAHVPDEALRAKETRDDAERRVARLFGAREDADVEPRLGLDGPAQRLAVRGAPHGFGGGGVDAPDPHGVGDGAEPAYRLHGAAEIVRVDGARLGQALAEAAEALLVEPRQRRATLPLVDDEPHRIRADVDDGMRRIVRHREDGVAFGRLPHADRVRRELVQCLLPRSRSLLQCSMGLRGSARTASGPGLMRGCRRLTPP